MAKLRVDEIQNKSFSTPSTEVAHAKRRRELHTENAFEKAPPTYAGIGRRDLSGVNGGDKAGGSEKLIVMASYTLPNRQTIEYPTVSDALRARLDEGRAQLSAQQRATLAQHVEALSSAIDASGSATAGGTLSPGVASALGSGASFLQQAAAFRAVPASQMITGDTIRLAEEKLRDLMLTAAERQQFGNEAKAVALELEEMLANWPDDGSTQVFSYRTMATDPDGKPTYTEHNNVELTKEEATALMKQMRLQGDTAASLTTMETFQIQQLTQKLQQSTEVLSTILKMTHEELSTIIAAIGKA